MEMRENLFCVIQKLGFDRSYGVWIGCKSSLYFCSFGLYFSMFVNEF
jgi:hypothetical protein